MLFEGESFSSPERKEKDARDNGRERKRKRMQKKGERVSERERKERDGDEKQGI